MKTSFNKKESMCLTELYRRLNCLCDSNLDEKLMYLASPGEAKILINLELIVPYRFERPRVLNWYSLSERGKRFFSDYINTGISDEMNQAMFEGRYIMDFDYKLYLESESV